MRADVPVKNVFVAFHIVVVAAFFLGRMWRGQLHGTSEVFRSPVIRGSLLFFAVAVASNPFGAGWTHESLRSLYDLASYIAFFVMLVFWIDSRLRLHKTLTVLLYSTMATAAFGMVQVIAGGYTSLWMYLSPSGDDYETWSGRATSFLNYANSLAGYLNLVIPFAIACCVLCRGKFRRLGYWTVGLSFLGLLCTQSIGGLGAFVAILVLAIFWFTKSRRTKLLLLAGVAASFCVLYFLKYVLNPSHTQEAFGRDAAVRLLLWATALNLFTHSPIIGVGWGNFIGLYDSYLKSFSDMIPPGVFAIHNIYLQLLAETGVVGLGAFFYLVIRAWRQARDQLCMARDPVELALAFGVLGALLSVLVHGTVDFLFQVSQQFGTLFWVLLALLVASTRLNGTVAQHGPNPQEI